jgi:cell shape-determining protein MreC|tara:strand:- start:47 stop:310 length:264 start_codon:yes stop_codon:yes gene_type:complete
MKEKTLLDMKKKVDALSNVMQHVYNEIGNLRELSVGTLETLKLMDGYTEAIETLKTNIKENAEKENEGKAKAEGKAKDESETKVLEL